MQRKTNRLLLLLIGTALTACAQQATQESGQSGAQQTAQPGGQQAAQQSPAVVETEAEIVSSTVDTPPEPEEIQYTEAELDVGDLGPVDSSDDIDSYAEENIGSAESGVSAAEEFVEEFPVTTYELAEEEEMPVVEEEIAVVEEEIGDLGAVDQSAETLSFAEESIYQEESVGDVTTYQSVTVNAEAQPLFAFDKSDVRASEQFKLESFSSDLAGAEFETIWVVGHADRIGSVDYNQGLSERRAKAVKAFLVRLGIDGGKVNSEGRSNLQPVTTEQECNGLRGSALIECYQPDRRVEVSVSAEVVREELN